MELIIKKYPNREDLIIVSTVIRVEKNREYVVMNNKFLRNKEMSLKAKGLLALCLSLPDTWDYSMNGLVAICKENITAVRSGLKELEEHGHLKINKHKNEKGHFEYEYVIYEHPYIENLPMDNQPVESLPVENHRQQSIEEESIEEENIDYSIYIDKGVNPSLIPLYNDYLEMRKSIQAPLTERGLKMLITRCMNLSEDNILVQRLMLENAIMNQWKNVYKPKEQEIQAAHQVHVNELKSFYGL